jgi:hypothetical protein
MPENYSDPNMNAAASIVVDGTAKTMIKASLAIIAGKQQKIGRYNDYYFGNHPFNFSSEKFTTKFANRLKSFRDNLCPVCVKAPADRLEVTGFSADQTSDIYKTSWALWLYSQMPRLSKRIHRDAFRTGDAYAVVWADDDGKARIYHQDVRNCTVFYNLETGNVESGAKVWRGNDGYVYLTLFFEDRTEKYITKNTQQVGTIPTTAAAFIRRDVPGETWPLQNKLGICPMFHFGLETSILDDVIPLNDALNKTIADLLVSSEANSLRQRWASGVAFEINPENGKQIIPFENVAQWVASGKDTAKFGQFADGDLKHFIDTAEYFVDQVSTVSGVPKYYFKFDGGVLPSGEALRKAESRFTSIIKDAQLDFGETWARVMKFAMMIDGNSLPAGAQFETKWSDADPLSSNEKVDLAIKKKQVGVSNERNLSELGYTEEDISAMQTENQAAAANQAAAFSKTFNAGPQLG